MAAHPTMNVYRGIWLLRNNFRGIRASPLVCLTGKTSATKKANFLRLYTLYTVFGSICHHVPSRERKTRAFSGDLRPLLPPSLFFSSSLVCELLNSILRFVRFAFVCVRIILLEWHATVKGMTFQIGLLTTRLSISECFRGASIGFASHKTAGSIRKSQTIRQANWRYEVWKGGRREVKRDGKKPKSRTICHFHAQKVVREQGIAGIFDYLCIGLRQLLYPRHIRKERSVMLIL